MTSPRRPVSFPPRPTRLEVIGGVQEPGTQRTKARESLPMTETLSRGSLQRRHQKMRPSCDDHTRTHNLAQNTSHMLSHQLPRPSAV